MKKLLVFNRGSEIKRILFSIKTVRIPYLTKKVFTIVFFMSITDSRCLYQVAFNEKPNLRSDEMQ